MSPRKKNVALIPAEKIALLAEKGLNKARLSHAEKLILAENGLAEFYHIKESIKTPNPSLYPQIIDNVMALYFPTSGQSIQAPRLMDISVQLTNASIKVIRNAIDWQPVSPVFAQRGDESNSTSFYKHAGKFTVHFEIVNGCERRFCINVILTDNLKREQLSFEAALFQNGQCVESLHVTKNPVASFSSVIPGDYLLKVTKNKEIISVKIGLEE